jgi:hypothetical protein
MSLPPSPDSTDPYAMPLGQTAPAPPSDAGTWVAFVVVILAVGVVIGFGIGRALPFGPSPGPSGGSGNSAPTCDSCEGSWLSCPAIGAPAGAAVPQIVAHTGTVAPGPSVTTSAIDASPGSLLLVFVGFVNPSIGGGLVLSISDSDGDSFTLQNSTGADQNHSEELYYTTTQGGSVQVNVTFGDADVTIGGSVGVVDISGAATLAFAGFGQFSGPGGAVQTHLGACSASDLFLLGVSGQARMLPFVGVQGAELLDSGAADAGPWTDGIGFGTFSATAANGGLDFSVTCGSQAAVWESLVVSVSPS